MVIKMYQLHSARWYVICDDDSFVFVDRLRRLLSFSLPEDEPLLLVAGPRELTSVAISYATCPNI